MLAYKTIVVGTDFSECAERGIEAAVRVANGFGARRLHLVHVLHASPRFALTGEAEPEATTAAAAQEAQRRLDALELPRTEVWVSREVRVGSPARELSRAADQAHADLVVVATRGHSALARLVLGSVPSSLIRVAHCPVLVVDGHLESEGRFRDVLAAIDLSPVSRNVLDNALAVARACAGEVHVISMFEPPILGAGEALIPDSLKPDELEAGRERHREAVDAMVRRVPREGVPLDVHVVRRWPVPQAILEVARENETELIVMGTSGRNAWHRMILGSTAHHVLGRAPCPVLVVPPEVRDQVREPAEALGAKAALGSH